MRTALTLFVAAGLAVGAAGAHAQVPPPGPADAPPPGAATLEGVKVQVTRQSRVRFRVRCIVGDVKCTGTIRLRTLKPISPGKGKARRITTIAEASFSELTPGEVKTVTVDLDPAAFARMKRYRETPAEWYTYFADGTRQEIFVPHRAMVTSALVKRP